MVSRVIMQHTDKTNITSCAKFNVVNNLHKRVQKVPLSKLHHIYASKGWKSGPVKIFIFNNLVKLFSAASLAS